jgi:flap endonuclease-1
MGIRGLTGWIQWASAKALTKPLWSSFQHKRVGIDILGFLYKAKAAGTHPVTYIAHLIAQCREHNIIPIPVFDGKPPDEKRDIIRLRTEQRQQNDHKRRTLSNTMDTSELTADQKEQYSKEIQTLTASSVYITTDERDEVKRLLYACGVRCLNANGEADNVLAYMAKRGELHAVMTNDMDLLTRGVPILLVPEGLGVPGDTKGWIAYQLDTILKESGLTYQQFVEMCVLMGCDYTTKVKSIPYKMAYFQLKYKGFYKSLEAMSVKDTLPYDRAVDILKGYNETAESLMTEKQWAKWSADPVMEPSYLEELQTTHLQSLSKTAFTRLLQPDTGPTTPTVLENPPDVRITI